MKYLFICGALLCALCLPASAQQRIVKAAEANGVWRDKDSGEIRILALGGGKLKVQFDLTYAYRTGNGELTANTGYLQAEAPIEYDTAVYSSTEFGNCKIVMKFLPGNKLKVMQEGNDTDCGFGHNVTADGTYRKIKAGKPKFENPEGH